MIGQYLFSTHTTTLPLLLCFLLLINFPNLISPQSISQPNGPIFSNPFSPSSVATATLTSLVSDQPSSTAPDRASTSVVRNRTRNSAVNSGSPTSTAASDTPISIVSSDTPTSIVSTDTLTSIVSSDTPASTVVVTSDTSSTTVTSGPPTSIVENTLSESSVQESSVSTRATNSPISPISSAPNSGAKCVDITNHTRCTQHASINPNKIRLVETKTQIDVYNKNCGQFGQLDAHYLSNDLPNIVVMMALAGWLGYLMVLLNKELGEKIYQKVGPDKTMQGNQVNQSIEEFTSYPST
ncbi:9648_t:CDS:2 [Acaulospora colombiana]|uniref:9648_t:CDS:1 n=1 Tax=Acaulospora colombiana TaxID=27376 RepID=A0ACA9KDD7_9GLOM|nr:9648_t:CDS:2 [Acaulospora colombiana]